MRPPRDPDRAAAWAAAPLPIRVGAQQAAREDPATWGDLPDVLHTRWVDETNPHRADVIARAHTGATARQIADELGIGVRAVRSAMHSDPDALRAWHASTGNVTGRAPQVARIRELARQGLTQREIADRCGITRQRVHQVITRDPRLHTQWRVASMRAAGATLAQIADALGVTERTVSRHVTALGLGHHGPAHGTSRRYDEGCGCEQCTEAHRVAAARDRDRQRQRGTRPAAAGRDLTHLDSVHAADQARTRAAATRAGRTWTGADLAVALDPRLTTTQAAERLGRSRAAVQHIRARNPGWRTR